MMKMRRSKGLKMQHLVVVILTGLGVLLGHMAAMAAVPQISAGESFTVALKEDGTVWTWGSNGFGLLGIGTDSRHGGPVRVSGLADVTAVAAGDYHIVALKDDGTVWAWGNREFGQLGDGTADNWRNAPVQVLGLADMTAVAAGGGHTVALKEDGTVWAWGGTPMGSWVTAPPTEAPPPCRSSAWPM